MSGISSWRFETPQILAAVLLLVFLTQCLWVVAHERGAESVIGEVEFDRVAEGIVQWHGRAIAGTPLIANHSSQATSVPGGRFDEYHSPLWYLIASAPVALSGVSPDHGAWLWLTRIPYVLFGTLLGASLWYVSRRLYGNFGGYTALALYCFCPTVIRNSTAWFNSPDIGGAWGAFGAVFTAIAVSHTLYAPREVVLWNWRRILLLGVSLALAIGSHFSLVVVLPWLAFFMLYVASGRKAAAMGILAASCILGVLLILAAYFFHIRIFGESVMNARWLDLHLQALGTSVAYKQVFREYLASGPVLLVLAPAAVFTYCAWNRTRYFGNTAPLLLGMFFLTLRVAAPHHPDSIFTLLGVIFFFVFIAGIAADLLETKNREMVGAVLAGLLLANAFWNLIILARIGA